jgi:hypothetical protein
MQRFTIASFTTRKLVVLALGLSVSLMLPGRVTARRDFSSNPQQASSERSPDVKINIRIGSKVLTARLANNETAQDFLSVLPINLSMKDLSGREKYAHLPKALSEEGPKKKRYDVGDIAYWSPSHDVAIYYHQDGETIPSPGIIPIAKINGGIEDFNVPGSVKVSIEIAK